MTEAAMSSVSEATLEGWARLLKKKQRECILAFPDSKQSSGSNTPLLNKFHKEILELYEFDTFGSDLPLPFFVEIQKAGIAGKLVAARLDDHGIELRRYLAANPKMNFKALPKPTKWRPVGELLTSMNAGDAHDVLFGWSGCSRYHSGIVTMTDARDLSWRVYDCEGILRPMPPTDSENMLPPDFYILVSPLPSAKKS